MDGLERGRTGDDEEEDWRQEGAEQRHPQHAAGAWSQKGHESYPKK
jgi:hypothetical protein